MKNGLRIGIAALLMMMAAVSAFAAPVLLEYKFAVGDVDKYRMDMDMHMSMPAMPGAGQMPPMNMTMTMTYIQKVLAVNPDGSAKLQVTYGAPSISGMPAAKGAKTPQVQGGSIIITMNKRGQTTAVEGLEKLAGSALKNMDLSSLFSSASQQALFPENPIEVGQSWTQDVPLPFGTSKIRVTSTLESDDQQMWGLKAAKVNQTFAGSLDMASMMKAVMAGMDAKTSANMPDMSKMMGSMDIDGNMGFLFAPSIGKLLKGNGTMKMSMTMNMPAEAVKQGAPSTLNIGMNMNINITRFK